MVTDMTWSFPFRTNIYIHKRQNKHGYRSHITKTEATMITGGKEKDMKQAEKAKAAQTETANRAATINTMKRTDMTNQTDTANQTRHSKSDGHGKPDRYKQLRSTQSSQSITTNQQESTTLSSIVDGRGVGSHAINRTDWLAVSRLSVTRISNTFPTARIMSVPTTTTL